jgi:acyl carrier protein
MTHKLPANAESVRDIIFDAIEELNQHTRAERRVTKSLDAVLYGQSGALDSLGLVNLTVSIERRIEEQFGVSVSLLNEYGSLFDESFRTVGSLCRYLEGLLTS